MAKQQCRLWSEGRKNVVISSSPCGKLIYQTMSNPWYDTELSCLPVDGGKDDKRSFALKWLPLQLDDILRELILSGM